MLGSRLSESGRGPRTDIGQGYLTIVWHTQRLSMSKLRMCMHWYMGERPRALLQASVCYHDFALQGKSWGQFTVITLEERTAEIDKNFQAFKKLLPTIKSSHSGEYALLRDRKIIKYFASASDAFTHAEKNYPDGVFSIQKVTDTVVDLGYFSHVENSWKV